MTIAVFDAGKTNLKLSAFTPEGALLETCATPSPARRIGPYRHIALDMAEEWLKSELRKLASRHEITHIVPCAHGSGGVLTDESRLLTPMIDYEGACPEDVDAAYRALVDSFLVRGGAIQQGATHLARQMLWLETKFPDVFAKASHYLPGPQYWAFRLSGRPAVEVTSLAAQSHLWDALDRRFTPLVERRGWGRLLPGLAPAWEEMGPLKPDFDASPTPTVLCGVHDSTANFYRYQRAGLKDFTIVSTGTWIVGLTDRFDPARLSEERGMGLNADVNMNPLAGSLVMGGREYGLLAPGPAAPVDSALIAAIIERGIFALPSFIPQDGLFPGSGGQGDIVGDLDDAPENRRAIALLYVSLLTDALLDSLDARGLVVLDGSFVAEPLYGALIAALRPACDVAVNSEGYGAAAGAALLASHASGTLAPVSLHRPAPFDSPGFMAYRDEWRAQAESRRA